MKIGLLGGSFNPPHLGHLHISKQALQIFGLDEIWWVISKQNPLKKTVPDSFNNRFKLCEKITEDFDNIKISNFDNKHNLIYAIDTISKIKQEYQNRQFIYLIGSDIIDELPKWHNWQEIFKQIPIAIFPRENYADNLTNSEIYKAFRRHIFTGNMADFIKHPTSPNWCLTNSPKHTDSSTKIRRNLDYIN